MPVSNDEEIRRALMLREVLDRVLQFEKTPCPFIRDFTVELPERPKTPVKKRTWAPPARTVSMNWPPGSPVTPPPEFPSRTRFYNPGARRFSDFGVDTSKTSLTPATSPGNSSKQEGDRPGTPTRRMRMEVSPISCKPLLEEPEPLLSPSATIPRAIPQSMSESPQTPSVEMPNSIEEPLAPTSAASAADTKSTEAQNRKREPTWITKPPSTSTSKAKRPAVIKTQSAGPMAPAPKPVAEGEAVSSCPSLAECGSSGKLEFGSPLGRTKMGSSNQSIDELEGKGGSLEGSGQLRVRRTRLAAFASRRAATAAPLKLRTSSTSTSSSVEREKPSQGIAEPGSPAGSVDSFFSMESWHSPLSPPAGSPTFSPSETYPHPHENIPLFKGQSSAFTATPTVAIWDRNSIGAVAGSEVHSPNTPFTDVHDDALDKTADMSTLEPSWHVEHKETSTFAEAPAQEHMQEELATDSDSLSTSWSSAASRASSRSGRPMRHRAATTSVAISHRNPRALSPLPPAANLLTTDLTPNRAVSATRAIRRIPSSIFNKTCEIIISPPAHLISLMLKVAARITAGEWHGFVFGMDEGGELLDVRWDWSDEAEFHRGWNTSDFDFTSRQVRLGAPKAEYRDPWATPPKEPDLDDGEHWSHSWGVD